MSRPLLGGVGYCGRFPIDGYVWHVRHHLLGFERLRWGVYSYEGSDYPSHSAAAREIARECVEGSPVLRPVLEATGL